MSQKWSRSEPDIDLNVPVDHLHLLHNGKLGTSLQIYPEIGTGDLQTTLVPDPYLYFDPYPVSDGFSPIGFLVHFYLMGQKWSR